MINEELSKIAAINLVAGVIKHASDQKWVSLYEQDIRAIIDTWLMYKPTDNDSELLYEIVEQLKKADNAVQAEAARLKRIQEGRQ